MNQLTAQELLENLIILLDHEIQSSEGEVVLFPTEEEIMEILQSPILIAQSRFEPQQPVAVIWHSNDGSCYWCIGFFVNQLDENTSRVDHLQSKDKITWYRPITDDIQTVNYMQILPCDIEGEWSFARRPTAYILTNSQDIDLVFKNE